VNEWAVELRLFFTVIVAALSAAGPVWVASRNSCGVGKRLMDSILLWLLVQYVAVGACGVVGVLHLSLIHI
jgi:hypothetical protein